MIGPSIHIRYEGPPLLREYVHDDLEAASKLRAVELLDGEEGTEEGEDELRREIEAILQ